MMISIDQIKKLRQETGISIIECQKALKKAKGDFKRAKEILRKLGGEFATEKMEKETGEGIIESYIHPGKRIGVLIELCCESDFVTKSEDFQKLAHELCLQIAAMKPPSKDSLLSQPWIRDETKTVKDLIEGYIAKFGENIEVKRYVRYEI